MKSMIAILIALQLISTDVFAAEKKNTKGLLPEVTVGEGSESENERKALSSEIMITRAENRAITAIQEIIKKSKGKANEADLYYRLAELYMKRSKSGRFFDLHRDSPSAKMSSFPVPNEKGSDAVRRAIGVYTKIEASFPKFASMDAVYFNNAFANQQVGQIKVSQLLYGKLLKQFPNSPLISDGTLAMGELLYDQGKFEEALTHFLKLEKFKESRVYSYGMYKAAWAFYNMRDSENGIKKLVQVIKINPALAKGEVPNNRHNMRKEALRDLTIFIGDSYPANKLYSFFEKITSEEELGQSMIDLAKLYESHSRQKEMNIFLNEYIKKNPAGPEVVRSHIYMIEANESLKDRDGVIRHLQLASELCGANSYWKSAQKIDVVEGSCVEGFRRTSMELAKKWWDVWLKNKQNLAFSDLTQRLFKIILENEDSSKPDLKTRFAYAELLFQLEKFDEASNEYLTVGQKLQGKKPEDVKMRHDANYAALYAKEQSISKKADPLKEADRKELAKNYLAKHPTGEHVTLVTFKMGHIAYMETDYAEAEKILKPLAALKDAKSKDIRLKSEDLILDILNIRKDYAGIKNFAKSLLASNPTGTRKVSLNKIVEESHFSEIQEAAKNSDSDKASSKLLEFANEHKGSPLAKDALWQALSLKYAEGNLYEGAELSSRYMRQYPEDKKNNDALKETASAYTAVGQFKKAAEAFSKLAEVDKKNRNSHLELAADIYLLESNTAGARTAYDKILAGADNKTAERIYGKLLATYKSSGDKKGLDKLENQISAKGIEPFSTQIMISRANSLFDQGKMSQAFDLSLKANSRNVSAEIRAEARLIQAKILEKELISQSVKSREDKFAMVISLKTEKLDKAHTAYFSTLKMSKDPAQHIQAMQGIDRCYGNYVENLLTMPLPASLSAEDQKVLREEIAKVVAPIQQKKTENAAALKALAASKGHALNQARNVASIPTTATLAPEIAYAEVKTFKPYFPDSEKHVGARFSRIENADRTLCSRTVINSGNFEKVNIFQTAAGCYNAKNFDNLETFGLELAKSKKFRNLGLFYASIGSEGRGNSDKALWLIEAALKTETESAPYNYQKARLLYQNEGINEAMAYFEKALNSEMNSPELRGFSGIKFYSSGDYSRAIKDLTSLTDEQLNNYNLGIALSEAYAQKGEVDKSLGVVKTLLSSKKDNVDFLLQQAHVLETYKMSSAQALESYEKALKNSQDRETRAWLGKKIEFLKNQNKVGQYVHPGDL